ncbi:hypothetical protein N0V90_008796 [Kalmusia sp. IMI 367209]|nr:hypothetical protein N0V90_008796 [Kalmusia sp. IMI 367209]
MDDKWMVITDTPEDAQGNIVVHACWGLRNYERFALTVAAGDLNKTDATIIKIPWKVERSDGTNMSEKEAKDCGIGFCKELLKCAMEEEDEEDDEDENKGKNKDED